MMEETKNPDINMIDYLIEADKKLEYYKGRKDLAIEILQKLQPKDNVNKETKKKEG